MWHSANEAELPAATRVVLWEDPHQVVDPRGLEEAQVLDVVHVLHRVEVAEAHSLHHREGGRGWAAVRSVAVAHSGCSGGGICRRAIAFTSFQNSAPAGRITARRMTAVATVDALSRITARITIRIARIASMPSTAQ